MLLSSLEKGMEKVAAVHISFSNIAIQVCRAGSGRGGSVGVVLLLKLLVPYTAATFLSPSRIYQLKLKGGRGGSCSSTYSCPALLPPLQLSASSVPAVQGCTADPRHRAGGPAGRGGGGLTRAWGQFWSLQAHPKGSPLLVASNPCQNSTYHCHLKTV